MFGDMRIAQVTPVFPPYRGGIGTVAEQYTNQLSRLGHDVTVVSPNHFRPLLRWGNAALIPQLVWRLRNFDVIHLHYPFYGGAFFAALAARFWRVPLVVTYHMKTKAKGWLGLIFRMHRWLIEPITLSTASVVLVSSEDYANSIGLECQNITEMPFGIDAKAWASPGPSITRGETREAIPPSYGGRGGPTMTILFVGGLDDAHYFKGVDVLLRACAKLRSTEWRLEIVGDGNRRAAYQELAKELGIHERVEFRGKLSNEGLRKAYKAAGVHVLPAIDRSEAFGLVTLEAAASGTPSIVSDLPGVRTLVDHQHTGLVIPPKDSSEITIALEWMFQHPKKRKEFGRSARLRVLDKYDEHRLTERLLEVYKQATLVKSQKTNNK